MFEDGITIKNIRLAEIPRIQRYFHTLFIYLFFVYKLVTRQKDKIKQTIN